MLISMNKSIIYYLQNLTGGCHGGVHITDVTNASRTQLMSLKSLQWDKRLLRYFEIPPQILPKIKSSAEIYGYVASGAITGVPIAGVSIVRCILYYYRYEEVNILNIAIIMTKDVEFSVRYWIIHISVPRRSTSCTFRTKLHTIRSSQMHVWNWLFSIV